MTIKTLTVIHEALHMQLERQKIELEALESNYAKDKEKIRRAIEEFESANFVIG